MEEFRADKEDWNQYVERLTFFFAANDITDDQNKHSIFLSADAYKLLDYLASPAKPADKSYKDLIAIMAKQSPAPSEIVQRYKFNSRVRKPGEFLHI